MENFIFLCSEAHSHDGILSAWGLELYEKRDSTFLRTPFLENTPLDDCFCCLENECHKEWKEINVVPAHEKSNKQLINNYRPESLLPICAKVFEKIIYNSIFIYLHTNSLLNNNQSGFRLVDSCMH